MFEQFFIILQALGLPCLGGWPQGAFFFRCLRVSLPGDAFLQNFDQLLTDFWYMLGDFYKHWAYAALVAGRRRFFSRLLRLSSSGVLCLMYLTYIWPNVSDDFYDDYVDDFPKFKGRRLFDDIS